MSTTLEPVNASISPVASPSKPKTLLSPQIKIEPASEWAGTTLSALDSTDHATQTPIITPGPDLPGAYPYTPSTLEPGPSFEEVKDTAKEYFQTASQYVPSQEDFKKVAQNAGSTIRGFIPNSVVTYLDPSQSRQEAITASPIDESETTPTAGGGFVLLNRGVRGTNDLTRGDHDSLYNSVNNFDTLSGGRLETSDPNAPEKNGQPKSGSTRLDGVHSSSLGNGQASTDASTRTQHGSSAVSEQDTEGIPTPFSYTGHTIGGTSSIDKGDSEVLIGATDGSSLRGHTVLNGDPHSKMNGQSVGVVNHGGPGAGLEDSALILPHSENVASPDPTPVGQTTPENGVREGLSGNANDSKYVGVNHSGLNSSLQHKKEEVEKPDREQKHADKTMVNGIVNTKPRTHPLGKEGTQWKGVPLEEEYQAALDRDEDRGLTIGESRPPAIPNAKPGTIPRKGDSPSVKPSTKDVISSTATTGHGDASDSGAVARTKSSEQPSSLPKENSQRGFEQTYQQPRPASPMTTEENPHVGRATTGPNSKKLRDPSNSSSEGELNRGRHKGNFLNKIKTWSKRLSRERKPKN